MSSPGGRESQPAFVRFVLLGYLRDRRYLLGGARR